MRKIIDKIRPPRRLLCGRQILPVRHESCLLQREPEPDTIEVDMTTVMILQDNPGASNSRFRAVAGGAQSEGDTAGAALDALTDQIGGAVADGMFVVVRPLRADSYFSESEQAELEALMAAWRTARDQNRALDPTSET